MGKSGEVQTAFHKKIFVWYLEMIESSRICDASERREVYLDENEQFRYCRRLKGSKAVKNA